MFSRSVTISGLRRMLPALALLSIAAAGPAAADWHHPQSRCFALAQQCEQQCQGADPRCHQRCDSLVRLCLAQLQHIQVDPPIVIHPFKPPVPFRPVTPVLHAKTPIAGLKFTR